MIQGADGVRSRVFFLALILVAAPLVAEVTVTQEVLSMLEAGLEEAVILEWLEAGPSGFDRPTAQELVALAKAGASPDLQRALIRRSVDATEEPPEPPPAPAPPAEPMPAEKSESPPPTPTKTPPSASAVPAPAATPPPAAEPPPAPQPLSDEVLVDFRLRYSPRYEEDEEEWGLYVYLDGVPLSFVPVASLFDKESLEFRQRLSRGTHVLRITQELHQKRRKGDRHRSRVAPESFVLDLREGETAEVELEFSQGLLSLGRSGPITYLATQEGKVLARADGAGGNPERWPELCEDLESALTNASQRARARRLEGCMPWADLWEGSSTPPRSAVIEALAGLDYRPVPVGSSR